MRKRARMWVLAGSFLVTSSLAAEPLGDLQARMAGLRNDQPTRIQVDVEFKHRGSAPLHLNKNKRRGAATVVYGPRGVESLSQKWVGSSSRFSFWKESKVETEISLLEETEALDLADPAGMMEFLLSEAVLLSDETATWKGQPARYLVIRPGMGATDRDGEAVLAKGTPLNLLMKVWLDETGMPLAMERSMEFRLGPALVVTESQAFTFEQRDGRLLVAEVEENFSSTALAVLRGRDSKKIKVTSVEHDGKRVPEPVALPTKNMLLPADNAPLSTGSVTLPSDGV